MRSRRRFWSLARETSGTPLISFALLGPVFLLFIFAFFEYAMFLFMSASLESAVREASRDGVTGSATEGGSRTDRILQIIEEQTLGMMDSGSATVRVQVFPSFADIGGGGGVDGPGDSGDVVLYEIEYPWTVLSTLMSPFFSGLTLTTSVAVRNEVF